MKGFKKIAVLCDVYEMSKGSQIKVGDKVGSPIMTDRIFGLLDANKRNSLYKDKRRWVDIKWEETAKLQLEAGNLDWVEYALEEKKLEAKILKRAIGFPVKDSYTEALEDNEVLNKYNDYIEVVESHIEILESIEFKPVSSTKKELEEGDVTIDSLKLIIKDEGLGIRVSKEDTTESIEAKITEARDK